ncbi:hypothetical protein [Actinoplanes subglobosus]|uniref:Pentapeptide repeat-containing protein n=1 Tax=Actinoplanes subglobosus TaxID=1547892 RepID=A0ABV8J0R6_9ACTN
MDTATVTATLGTAAFGAATFGTAGFGVDVAFAPTQTFRSLDFGATEIGFGEAALRGGTALRTGFVNSATGFRAVSASRPAVAGTPGSFSGSGSTPSARAA